MSKWWSRSSSRRTVSASCSPIFSVIRNGRMRITLTDGLYYKGDTSTHAQGTDPSGYGHAAQTQKAILKQKQENISTGGCDKNTVELAQNSVRIMLAHFLLNTERKDGDKHARSRPRGQKKKKTNDHGHWVNIK